MADEDDDEPRLKVDRLARAMQAARNRHGGTRRLPPLLLDTPVEPEKAPSEEARPPPPDTARALPGARPERPARPEDAGAPGSRNLPLAPPPTEPAAPPAAPEPPRLVLDTPASPPPLTAEAVPAAPGPIRVPVPSALEPRLVAATTPPTQARRVERPYPAPRGPTLVALSALSTSRGPMPQLNAVDIDVPTGAVTALIGPDGGGRSAVLRAIIGLDQLTAGRIRLGGDTISEWPVQRRAAAGIGYVPADGALFPGLTVAQHLSLGDRRARAAAGRIDWIASAFPALRQRWRSRVETLPRDQRRVVALARALVAQRRLYLLDSPSAGLDEAAISALAQLLRDLTAQGAAVLLAEAHLGLAAAIGDRAAALSAGRCLWTGEMSALLADPDQFVRLAGETLETP